jgi:hypothetical protein
LFRISDEQFHSIPGVAALDLQAHVHKNALASLYKQQNTFVYIHQLPSDLISDILLQCKPAFPQHKLAPAFRHRARVDYAKCINQLANVCSHWRKVALATPALWTSIFLIGTRAEWAMLSLSRTKALPLLVDITVEDISLIPKKDIEIIFSHLGRIQELFLEVTLETLNKFAPQLSLPAPRLTLLSVTTNTGIPTLNPWVAEATGSIVHIHITDDTLPRDVPRLSYIALERASARWNSPLFGVNITTLILDQTPLQNRPSFSQFWDLLLRMPNLQVLKLHGVVENFYEWGQLANQQTPAMPIQLPHLREFDISQGAGTTALVLRHVKFPSYTKLDICLGQATHDLACDTSVFDSVTEQCLKGDVAFKTIHILHRFDHQCVSAFRDIPLNMRDPEEDVDIALDWQTPPGVDRRLYLINMVKKIFPWDKVEALYVFAGNDWDAAVWSQLADVPNLHTLYLEKECASGFVTALADPLAPPSPISYGSPKPPTKIRQLSELPFRQLKHLFWHSVNMEFLSKLLPRLTERREAGIKLATLFIRQSRLAWLNPMYTLLEGDFVDNIDWDRVCIPRGSDDEATSTSDDSEEDSDW